MESNNTMLTRFFTQNTLQNVSTDPCVPLELMRKIVRRYQIPTGEADVNGTVISEIYHYVSRSYRNEYFYKNTLLNKLIINLHRVNTTTALTEVPIAKSKADFIMINGKAVVYEIKTELDTFERLLNQIADYYKAFDHVCVVTSEQQLFELQRLLGDSPVGIYLLNKKNRIHKVKEPQEYKELLDKKIICKILNKPEYEAIVLSEYGALPNVTPVNYYKECSKLLYRIPMEKLYALFLRELKKRNKIEIIDYSTIPEALHFLVYFSKNRTKKVSELHSFLNDQFEGDENDVLSFAARQTE